MAGPCLSVVVARSDPEPRVRSALAGIVAQARELDAEVILADGTAAPLPPDEFPEVVRVYERGAGVYRLRALGAARARGQVVAFTEDHCLVNDDWCRCLVEAHQSAPEAVAIGGVVENGSTESLRDWAHFLIPNGAFLAPLVSGPARVVSGSANLSFKRGVLPAEAPPQGVLEMLFTRALAARGESIAQDGRLIVRHVQSPGLSGTLALHFHAGRSLAGARRATMGLAERMLRLAGCALLPPVMLARTLASVGRKRRRDVPLLASVPWMIVLLLVHAGGEGVGYLSGPGRSPALLH